MRHHLERRADGFAGMTDVAFEAGLDLRISRVEMAVGIGDLRLALVIAQKEPVLRIAGLVDDEPRGVGIADQVVEIDVARL